jgi:hypothetical protein
MIFEAQESTSFTKWQMIKDKLVFIFLDSWIYLFIFSIIVIIIGQFIIREDLFVLLYMLTFIFIIISLSLKYTKNIHYTYRIIIIVAFVVNNILLYLFFLFFMTIVSMQINFETDKNFYTIDDKFVIVKVDTRGYIYKPYYALICRNDGKFPSAINGYCGCFKISTNKIEEGHDTTISVHYYNSFLNKYLTIVKQTQIKVYLSPPRQNHYSNVKTQYSR